MLVKGATGAQTEGLSWDDQNRRYYYVHMFRRLSKILPSQLLLNIYKSYVQSIIYMGLYYRS